MTPPQDDVDVAIVGGGVSGLYCGYRVASGGLLEDSPLRRFAGEAGPRVGVFEASGRTGGRLYTVSPSGARSLRGELGGIAVVSTHRLVVGVTDALGLEREPLPGRDPKSLLHLRGRRFRAEQWSDADVVPYDLDPSERGRTPEEIFRAAVERVVPGAAELTPAGWERAKREAAFNGTPLSDLGLWDLLHQLVSPDAFRLIGDASVYRPEFQNWNAADALADLSAGWPPEARFESLRGGYEALPSALAERFEEAGGELALGHRLQAVESIEHDGAPALKLSFEAAGGSAERTVTARHLVLALPLAPLARVAHATPLADTELPRDLESISVVPLFHLLLGYESPWWEELGIRAGRSATDLPVQTCFYFGTDDESAGDDSAVRRSLAMVGYSSEAAIAFWDSYLGGGAEAVEPKPAPPPAEMQAEVTRQLGELHGVAVPDPYWATLLDWRSELYGAASHRWEIGAHSWELIPRIRRPAPDLPIHACGEAFSDLQGWTEGALRTAERVLQDELGVEPPGWLEAGAYLGP